MRDEEISDALWLDQIRHAEPGEATPFKMPAETGLLRGLQALIRKVDELEAELDRIRPTQR